MHLWSASSEVGIGNWFFKEGNLSGHWKMLSGSSLIFLCIKAIIPGQHSVQEMGLTNFAQQMFRCCIFLIAGEIIESGCFTSGREKRSPALNSGLRSEILQGLQNPPSISNSQLLRITFLLRASVSPPCMIVIIAVLTSNKPCQW
jgi:hypothetical protein